MSCKRRLAGENGHHRTVEILQLKRYWLFVKLPHTRNKAVGKTDDKMCNKALFYTKLARPRNINGRIPMVYLDMLYIY